MITLSNIDELEPNNLTNDHDVRMALLAKLEQILERITPEEWIKYQIIPTREEMQQRVNVLRQYKQMYQA